MQNNNTTNIDKEAQDSPFRDLSYLCKTTKIIIEALKKGSDVAQLPNGDIMVTEMKVINTQYRWSKSKQKLIKISGV